VVFFNRLALFKKQQLGAALKISALVAWLF
jgi:hypothetical protein